MNQTHRLLLTDNFKRIKKLCQILWNKRFEKLFSPLGVEYEDYEAQALLEISANIHTYDPTKGTSFLTFCGVIVNNKLKTYATHLNRDKRIINSLTVSLNQTDKTEAELIEGVSDSTLTDLQADFKTVEKILQVLPKNKREILKLLMYDYTAEEISNKLHLPIMYVKDVASNLHHNPKLIQAINILLRR